jgi:type 2 lantibiotic biosynthesis protein LanM
MTPVRDEIFLDAAAFLGRRLCRDALWAGDRCNWLGDSMEFVGGAWGVIHRALGPDIYGGTSGVALFLATLHRLTGEPLFRITAEGALAHALSRTADFPSAHRVGFYAGWTGIAYAMAVAGNVFDDAGLIDKADAMIVEAAREVGAETGLDVLSGSAGAIPALIDFQRHGRRDDLIAIAERLGEHLLTAARKSDAGWSWNTLPGQADHDLTGFSHGTSGVAWALLELFAATGDARFRDAAERGFAYERQWFSKEQENWPDFRTIFSSPAAGGGPSYMVAWCHGAPGIGLARVRAYELTGGDMMRQEAEAAIRTTTRMLNQPSLGPPGDFTLCHGRAGNAELLIYAAQVFGDETMRAAAEVVGRQGIETFRRKDLPWPCGVPGGNETPNLLLGLAGIGYFYLRLYDPVTVPSVLIVRPSDTATPLQSGGITASHASYPGTEL